MKWLKDLLNITLFVFIMYTPLMWLSVQNNLQKLFEQRTLKTKDSIERIQTSAKELLSHDQVLELCVKLETEWAAKNIVGYRIQSADLTCQKPDQLVSIDLPVGYSQVQIGDLDVMAYHENFSAKHDLRLYFIRLPPMSFFNELKSNSLFQDAFIKELVLVIYIIFIFMIFSVVSHARVIQNQYRSKGHKDPIWLRIVNILFSWIKLQDLRVLETATSKLIQQKEDLLKDKDLLETSLEYSILNEVRENNQQIPYTFFGTVARVDINGFSKVVSSGHTEISYNLTLFLEDFGCELLQRYGGLFEKTVGDEIVVVFKSKDSALMATAFARDLMFEFSQLQFDFGVEKRSFTLKGSICSSDLTFSKRAPGYGFQGDALTYTARLLDVVKQKDRNVLSFLSNEKNTLVPLLVLDHQTPQPFEFKNMPSASGFLISDFINIEQVYDHSPKDLIYFRSNSDIIYLFKRVQNEPDLNKIDFVFECLKKFVVRKCNQQLTEAWALTIQIFEKKAKEDKRFIPTFSKIIMESSRLIPKAQWNNECSNTLLNLDRNVDGRINASTVDVFIEKDLYQIALENELSFIIESDPSSRTRGNLLLSQAYQNLDDSIFKRIIKMLDSESSLEKSTGIYCACSVILYYKKHNPAELEIHSNYKIMLKKLQQLQKANSGLSIRLIEFLNRSLS